MKIKLKDKEDIYKCKCGGKYTRAGKWQHNKTQMHKDWYNNRPIMPPLKEEGKEMKFPLLYEKVPEMAVLLFNINGHSQAFLKKEDESLIPIKLITLEVKK
jgi:hypothetical protein